MIDTARTICLLALTIISRLPLSRLPQSRAAANIEPPEPSQICLIAELNRSWPAEDGTGAPPMGLDGWCWTGRDHQRP